MAGLRGYFARVVVEQTGAVCDVVGERLAQSVVGAEVAAQSEREVGGECAETRTVLHVGFNLAFC